MWQGMKSVMVFDPKDTEEQSFSKFMDYVRDNHSAIGDKAVPNAEETRKLLSGYSKR